jgi:hypothetical protein
VVVCAGVPAPLTGGVKVGGGSASLGEEGRGGGRCVV